LATLTDVQQRAITACVGSCVADAAARPTHWLYDASKLQEALSTRGDEVEFHPVSISPFYDIATGENSCYYDLGLTCLQSLPAESSTPYSIDTYKQNLLLNFGPGTAYDLAYKSRLEKYDPAKRYETREPVPGPWIQGACVKAVESLLAGQEPDGSPASKETDGLVSTIPLVCRISTLVGEDFSSLESQMQVRNAAVVLSNNPVALRHTLSAACILASVIRNGEQALEPSALLESARKVHNTAVGDEEFESVLSEISTVVAADPSISHVEHVSIWGKPCANPGSFMGALHATVSSSCFADGIRKSIRAGGCNCSRCNLAGALLGAAFGIGGEKGIPLAWLEQSTKALYVFELALEKLSS